MYNIIGYEDYNEYNYEIVIFKDYSRHCLQLSIIKRCKKDGKVFVASNLTLGSFKEIDEGCEINGPMRLPFNTVVGVQNDILKGPVEMKETLVSMKLHLEDLRKLLKLRD